MSAISSSLRPIVQTVQRLVQHLREQDGAELVEFAVSLPLLVVFVVGIYDFGAAFTLKQKLGNITLEAARIAASQPMNDLSNPSSCTGGGTAPASICEIRDIVANDLAQNHVNDCGLSTANASLLVPLKWQFTTTGSCASAFTIQIDRGNTFTADLQKFLPRTFYIEATQVTMKYPYQWQFGRVIGLLVRGATFSGSTLNSQAVMQNLN